MKKTTQTLSVMALAAIVGTLTLGVYANDISNDYGSMSEKWNTITQEQLDSIITEHDWETLSMQQIDQKLKKAGLTPIGDKNDELYTKTPAEVYAISDKAWEKIDAVITEYDWENLSMQQIDKKLKKAGLEPFGDRNDGFYDKTPAEIDKILDKECKEIDAVITEHDWDTLSMKQIDEKLKKAGIDPIGDKEDPLYTKTPTEISAMSDDERNAVEKIYEKLEDTIK